MLSEEEKQLIQKIRTQWEFWFRKQNISQLLHIYIPSDCSNSQNYSESSRYPLNKAAQDFLNSEEQKILLVLGDSGSGKTSLTLKLEQSYWEMHSTLETMNGYTPIRVELKSYTTKTISGCIEDTLGKKYEFTKDEINHLKKSKDIKLLIIFDGYDEIGGRAEFNLYNETKLSEWKCDIKSVVTCRSQHFTGEEEFKKCCILCQSQTNTKLYESLKIIYGAPFSEAQMNQYLVKYAVERVKKKEVNKFPLEEIQELLKIQLEFKNLLSNPFVLKIFSEVAPKLLQVTDTPKSEKVRKINRAKIYQSFLEDWFFRAKIKLEESVRVSELNKKPKDVEKYFFGYAQRLAYAYFKEGITELEYKEVSSDEEEFEEYREIEEGNVAFKDFFGSEKPEVVEARKACPLRRSGDSTYSFVHKSFQDYLVGRHLYLVLKSGNEKPILESWNARYLSEDRAVLRFLSELVESDEKKKELGERLSKIIQSSRQSEAIDKASSNAVSVLNWNRYSFGGMDLQGIRIPKAYLEGVNFSGANLRRSHMRGSYVRNSEWSEADLRGGDLSELEYGEYPDWEQGSKVECLVFNAAGTLLASGDDEGYLRLWRHPDGELLRSWKSHAAEINSVSFSVDGKRLASGSEDKTIRLWSVESGQEERVLLGHTERVTSVSFSYDGKRLASGGYDRTIRIWSVETGQEERRLTGHTNWVTSVSFSGDGKRLASGGWDKTIRLWSVESGQEERRLTGHTREVTSVSFSSDGKRLASGGGDRTIRLCELAGGECAEATVFNQTVSSVAFYKSEESKEEYLAAGIGDGVYVFCVEESELESKSRLILKWRSEYYLRAQGANLTNIKIDDANRRLLEQRGAKKSNSNHEADKEKNESFESSSQNSTQEDITSSSHSPQPQSNSTPTYLNSAMRGDFETMQNLYNPVMNVNFGNEKTPPEKRSTLHWACYHRNKKAVRFLLSHHADVNLLDVNKQTPLHLVLLPRYDAENNQKSEDKKIRLSVFSKLLLHQARIDLKNSHGKTVVDLSEALALQNPIMEPEYFFLILIQTQCPQIIKLTKLIQSIFKINFQAFKSDISSCLRDYKNPSHPDNQSNNKQLVNQILQNLLFIDKVEYNVFQYLAHLRDKGGMITDVAGKFIPATINPSPNSEKIKVVFPKTENGWIQGQSFEGWNNIDFLIARMHVFIQIWLDYKNGFIETGLSDEFKKVFEERLEKEIYTGIIACLIAQVNDALSKLSSEEPFKEKLRAVFNRVLSYRISQLSKEEVIYYPTGNARHSVYVSFKRLREDKIGTWIDNIGDYHEHYGHETKAPRKKHTTTGQLKIIGHKKVYSYSLGKLDISLFRTHATDIEAYFSRLNKAGVKSGTNGLDKVYILPEDLEPERYEPQFQPKRELTKGHCVLRNHNVGLLHRFFYQIPNQAQEDTQKPGRMLYKLLREREEATLLRMK